MAAAGALGVVDALALGVVQGLTEFLPVSSDGHLALAYRALSKPPDLAFEVFLHFATLIALFIYFRSDVWDILLALVGKGPDAAAGRRTAVWIVLATVVSGVIALAVADQVERLASNLVWVGVFFLFTAAFLAAAELMATRAGRDDAHAPDLHPEDLGWVRSVAIGVAQGAAALPGVSRSGMTIATTMMSGVRRETAARFGFVLGIPIILAATAKNTIDVIGGSAHLPGVLPSAVGFVAAGVSGYLAIWGLLGFVKRHPLWAFSVYTALVGVLTIAWGLTA